MSKGDKTIFRVASRHKPYSQLGNAMIRDNRLSFEARGVLSYILSFPSNWQFGLHWLCRETHLGRDKARRIVKELVAVGYCQRGRIRNPDGRLGRYEYVFTDEPEIIDGSAPPAPEKPSVDATGVNTTDGFTGAGSPVTGQPALANPTTTKEGQSTKQNQKVERAQEQLQLEGTDAGGGLLTAARQAASRAESERAADEIATGERVPFTPEVVRELTALDVDVGALIERYQTRTRGRSVDDPSAYLLAMGRDEAAKRLGIPLDRVKALGSRNCAERGAAMATAVGASAAPSERAMRSARRYRKPHEIELAQEMLSGRIFASVAEADRALELALTNVRFLRAPTVASNGDRAS